MKRVLEIRSYRLKAGSRAAFHALVTEQSMPLHRKWGMDVVSHGPSLHDPDAWREGPRDAIVALIEADANTVICLSATVIEGLRTP